MVGGGERGSQNDSSSHEVCQKTPTIGSREASQREEEVWMLKGEGVDEETVGGNKGNNRSGEAAGGENVRRGSGGGG